MSNLRKAPDEPKYRRVRLNNAALEDQLLRHVGGRKCLEALGFTQQSTTDAGDECLALSEMSPPSDGEHALLAPSADTVSGVAARSSAPSQRRGPGLGSACLGATRWRTCRRNAPARPLSKKRKRKKPESIDSFLILL